MKINTFFVPLILLGTLLFSCNNNPKPTQEVKEEEMVKEKVCSYSYDHATTNVHFMAYKLKNKAEVHGDFDSIVVGSTAQSASSIKELLESMTFEIFVAGVNTKDAARDEKIKKFFFGVMNNTAILSGSITAVNGTNEKGTVTAQLKMNDQENAVNFDYTMEEGNVLKLKSSINILDWQGDEALKSLHEKCKERHTDPDGTAKIWEDVGLIVKTTLKKECD